MVLERSRFTDDEPLLLCIDDDPQISETIAVRFMEYKVEVLRAFYGTHGMWLAMTHKPDLIITDINMPQGDGSQVIEYLKNNADTRDIPVVVLTGQREMEARMRQLGADRFIRKPIPFESLLAVVREFIPVRKKRTAAPARS